MSLPNLSSLTLQATPMGALFEEFEDALGNITAAAEKRNDWDASKWMGADAPDCPICFEPLNRRSTNGAQTKEVEVLLENPACSHAFHRECIEMWIQTALDDNDKALRCPTCSRPIDQVVLDTVFDASANIQEVAENDGFDAMVQQQQENAAPTDLSLFGGGPPMFQGKRIYGIEYVEVQRTQGFRTGWLVNAALKLGDGGLRAGAGTMTFVLEVYSVTDYEPNDPDLILYKGGQFVAKVMRSMRPFVMNDFNSTAWPFLKKQIPPLVMGVGLDTSMTMPFYTSILVALGMPAKRIARADYNSWRERESQRDSLPHDWL